MTITEGWFNIELGSITAPLPTFASPPYYLQLQVNGETLTPRLKLASVPSAIQSATSDLLPFSGTYAGSAPALSITANQANDSEGIWITRGSGSSLGYCIFAANEGEGPVLWAQQSSLAAASAGVASFFISGLGNDGDVIRGDTNGSGAVYSGWGRGPRVVSAYGTGAAHPDEEAHVIHAVYSGIPRSANNIAVYGEALDDEWGIGGDFYGNGIGVRGTVEAPSAGALVCAGVIASASGTNTGTNIGVWGQASGGATNYAGWFSGNVDISGTLTKSAGSFKIDHPLDPANKYLYHSFVESPDMMNIYNGNVELDAAGEARVELPEWFEALNQDFRYQLTPIGAPAPGLYVADEIAGNRFRIAGGEPGTRVSWQVTGIRHDAYADAHRIPVEEVKSAREQGSYRNPDLYGMPASAGVLYDERAATAAARAGSRAPGGRTRSAGRRGSSESVGCDACPRGAPLWAARRGGHVRTASVVLMVAAAVLVSMSADAAFELRMMGQRRRRHPRQAHPSAPRRTS